MTDSVTVDAHSDMIVTRTPLRISFAGGGTDLRSFYAEDHGAVLSTTIDRHVYVTVKEHGPVFDERIRLNYSVSEGVQDVGAIRNNIARECLLFLGIESRIYISVVSDLPESSGLGGSSSFTVGLLNALHRYLGHEPTSAQLAEEASRIEIEVLGEPIGKQDQYAAAFGGLNVIRFCADERVMVEPLNVDSASRGTVFSHLLMLWTGHQRPSSSILREQQDRTAEHRAELELMRDQVYEAAALVAADRFDAEAFGALMDMGWQRKRQLATAVTNPQIDAWYEAARAAGAYGGKLCGAGGGGFLLFVAPPERHAAIADALPNLPPIGVQYAPAGSSVLLPPGVSHDLS